MTFWFSEHFVAGQISGQLNSYARSTATSKDEFGEDNNDDDNNDNNDDDNSAIKQLLQGRKNKKDGNWLIDSGREIKLTINCTITVKPT